MSKTALSRTLAQIEAQNKNLEELRRLQAEMTRLLRRMSKRDDLTVQEALEIWKMLHPKL